MYFFAVLKRFVDVDHLISLCVQIPKHESVKTAEHKITQLIYLKHTLELVEPLQRVISESENVLLKAYHEVSDLLHYALAYITPHMHLHQ